MQGKVVTTKLDDVMPFTVNCMCVLRMVKDINSGPCRLETLQVILIVL